MWWLIESIFAAFYQFIRCADENRYWFCRILTKVSNEWGQKSISPTRSSSCWEYGRLRSSQEKRIRRVWGGSKSEGKFKSGYGLRVTAQAVHILASFVVLEVDIDYAAWKWINVECPNNISYNNSIRFKILLILCDYFSELTSSSKPHSCSYIFLLEDL